MKENTIFCVQNKLIYSNILHINLKMHIKTTFLTGHSIIDYQSWFVLDTFILNV